MKPVFPQGIISQLLGRGKASGFGTARLAEIQRKCKNSGNEAKEYLKTKDMTF